MDGLRQDLKFALRMLRKTPSVTAVAVLTLAIAIGATTSIFSAVSSMLLRPLPFPHPEELVALQDFENHDAHGFSWPEFKDIRSQGPDLARFAAYRQETSNLTGRGEPRVVVHTRVTDGFFALLGVQPVAGRFFTPEEHVENAPPTAVVSEGFWHDVLGGVAPGTTITLDGLPYVLAGVAPQSISATLILSDVYSPLERKLPWTERGTHYLETVGRLKPGVSPARAKADLAIAAPRIAEAAKATHLAVMQSLQEFIYGPAQPLLLLLLAAVGLVLLIAAVNLASVVLSRATGRVREFAVRRALGASRGMLARQLLVESAVVGVAGGGFGILLALWGRDLILRVWPPSLPKLYDAPIDWRVLAFAALVSIGTGVGIGLLPALQASRSDVHTDLREGAGASPRGRARSLLVVLQSALAVVLLVSAALVLRSLTRMLDRGPGFHARSVLSVRIPLPPQKYSEPQRIRFFHDLVEAVQSLPGVRAAGVVSRVPLGGGSTDGNYSVVGRPPLDDQHQRYADKRVASPGYFAAMQIPIVRGRAYADGDPQREIVINEKLARDEFPGEDPVGRQIAQGSDPTRESATIVGVAADVKQHRLNEEPNREIYFPQSWWAFSELDLVVRTDGDPMALLPAVKAKIALLDPTQPVTKVRTIEEVLERNAGPQRLAAQLLGAFAMAALLLAALGIYGVVSYAVSRREREIGVRMALGAQAGDVLRMVISEGLRLSLFGAFCGLAAALALARLLAGFLYGVSARDPITYVAVAAGLVLAAATASFLPARRATRVDPAVALRAE